MDGGFIYAGARHAATSAAATPRRRSTPAGTPLKPATPSSRATSPARTGSGTTRLSSIWTKARDSRRQLIIRSTNRHQVPKAACRKTGSATCTERGLPAQRSLVSLCRPAHGVLAVHFDVAFPPGSIDAVKRKRIDRRQDAVDLLRRQRDVVRKAVHEAHPSAV